MPDSLPGRAGRANQQDPNRNMTRLQQEYVTTIVPKLRERLGIENVMEVPRITKITLNMGVGETITDKKVIEKAVQDMTSIAGQKPQITLARKSVATFKVREGYPVGCKVTLRRARMYELRSTTFAESSITRSGSTRLNPSPASRSSVPSKPRSLMPWT